MNPLIENHVKITKEVFQEWSNSSIKEAYKKTLRKTAIFLVLLFVLYAAWVFSHGGTPFIMIGEALLMSFIYLYVVIYQPKKRRRNQYKNLCKASNGTPARIVRFYPDRLSVTTDSGKVREFKYSQMQEVRETPSLYVLSNTTNTDILLAKDGFTTGTAEQALALLSAKTNQEEPEVPEETEALEDSESPEEIEALEDTEEAEVLEDTED